MSVLQPSVKERIARPWDVVDEASLESFPASDPPGWGSSHASTAPEPEPARERDPTQCSAGSCCSSSYAVAAATSIRGDACDVGRRAMERKRITCPETAHLEEIDYERTPHGIVIAGCSRFEPRCSVECGRECSKRMDRRDRLDIDDRTERVLVVFPAKDVGTRSIAEMIARDLARDGMIVELADTDSHVAPPPADYEAVVLGSPLRFGRLARSVVDYVARHREALAAMPAFFYAVDRAGRDAGSRVTRVTGWQPTRSAAFGSPRAREGIPRFWRWLAGWFDGATHATDGKRDFAGDSRVHDFTRMIAEEVPAAELAST